MHTLHVHCNSFIVLQSSACIDGASLKNCWTISLNCYSGLTSQSLLSAAIFEAFSSKYKLSPPLLRMHVVGQQALRKSVYVIYVRVPHSATF